MIKTKKMLQKCKEVLLTPRVCTWYGENLEGIEQSSIIEDLLLGIDGRRLTVKEALYIAFLVGFQWHDTFEGAH